jgi:hypothetical protein
MLFTQFAECANKMGLQEKQMFILCSTCLRGEVSNLKATTTEGIGLLNN